MGQMKWTPWAYWIVIDRDGKPHIRTRMWLDEDILALGAKGQWRQRYDRQRPCEFIPVMDGATS